MLVSGQFADLFVTPYVWNYKFYIYIVVNCSAEFLAWLWDVYVDFGLWRTWKWGKFWGLRENILYPSWVYWFAIVEDFIFRFWFIISLFAWS